MSAQNQPMMLEYSVIWLGLFNNAIEAEEEEFRGLKINEVLLAVDGILVAIGKRLTQTGGRWKSSLQGYAF